MNPKKDALSGQHGAVSKRRLNILAEKGIEKKKREGYNFKMRREKGKP